MLNYDDHQSLYDDEDDPESEPYLYSPENVRRASDVEAEILNRQNDYEDEQPIPFYGETTNGSTYTWKVPTAAERKAVDEPTTLEETPEKIPFYSETTNRSAYVPYDLSVRRTKLSNRNVTPTLSAPFATETTYRNLYLAPTFARRQKTIHTCPAEKIIHQTSVLQQARHENGHYFIKSNTMSSEPPLLKQPTTDTDK